MIGHWRRVCEIAIDTLVRAPRRRRNHDRHGQAYTYRTQDGLNFGLEPGQWIDLQIATYGLVEHRFLEAVRDLLPDGAVCPSSEHLAQLAV